MRMKRFLCLCVVLMLTAQVAFAYESYGDGAYVSDQLGSWRSDNIPGLSEGYLRDGSNVRFDEGSSSALMTYFLLLKTESLDFNEVSFESFYKDLGARGLYASDWGLVDIPRVVARYDTIELVYDMVDMRDNAPQESLDIIEGFSNQGYYVLMYVSTEEGLDGFEPSSGAYLLVDSFEDGILKLMDVTRPGVRWSDYYNKADSAIEFISVFQADVPSTGANSLYLPLLPLEELESGVSEVAVLDEYYEKHLAELESQEEPEDTSMPSAMSSIVFWSGWAVAVILIIVLITRYLCYRSKEKVLRKRRDGL